MSNGTSGFFDFHTLYESAPFAEKLPPNIVIELFVDWYFALEQEGPSGSINKQIYLLEYLKDIFTTPKLY